MALLPIGGTFTMDLAEAVRAAMAIKPKVVIPMHRSKADPQDFDMTFAYQCAKISMATQYSMSVPTKYLELIACGPNNNGSHE